MNTDVRKTGFKNQILTDFQSPKIWHPLTWPTESVYIICSSN